MPEVEHIQAVGALAAGAVKGVDHEGHTLFPVGHVDLGPADVVANGQADADAPDVVCHQAVSGRNGIARSSAYVC